MHRTTITAQVTRKLYSRKGTLLGTVSYPAWWDDEIMEGGGISFHVEPPLSFSDYMAMADKPTIRTAAVVQHWPEREAVRLSGITPEEFELLPNCSFAPGAGYLRSLLEG